MQSPMEKLISITKRGPVEFSDLCNKLDVSPAKARALIEQARALGVNVHVEHNHVGVHLPETDGSKPAVAPGGSKYVPRPMRGPATSPHYVPEGHELGGVSRLTDADGTVSAEWSKTRVAGADEPPVPVPPSFLLKKASTMRRGDGSTVVEWNSYERDKVAQWEDIKLAIAEHVAAYVKPAVPTEASPKYTELRQDHGLSDRGSPRWNVSLGR